MHSTFSDGEFSPEELVDIAKGNGVSILSLTDHDTFDGIADFLEAANRAGIVAFPGIEITVKYRDFNLHLLAYFKSAESILPELRERVRAMRDERDRRMLQLIARMNEVVPAPFQGAILYDNVLKNAEGVLGRPHLAREMVRLKIVSSPGEAFEKYLNEHNIEKQNLTLESAIKLVRQSQGIPVLAHPGERHYSLYNPARGRDYDDIPGMLEELTKAGLLGLECVYPYHERIGKVDFYRKQAERFGLIVTGSRDFHGYNTFQRNEILGSTPMDDAFLKHFQEAWG
jgi:predicted metal-dependent phosphoesterase TrpH